MKKLLISIPALLLLAACGSAPDDTTASPSAVPSATPPVPAFTDVSRGDTDSIVKLLQFTPGKGQAVVVEPVIFLTNPEFCETFHLPADDKRCNSAWNTADSEAKITLPRADDAVLALVDQSDVSACMDEMGAGSCETSATDFAARLGDGPHLIRLTTRDGIAVRLAELYVP
ncbi:hypothetical protein [Catenuloplanes indicus]|uniref:Nitrous oxide reductase accessory protein NosL n=1 Tax=Catenuloplanes indicus TaxID=137267 RepID=A0AAE3W814_9ACTN|nr:hypothetical protein [Catenuloplanes indicus]MDQ0370165.1 nitrous oxide reductase accessory protein NosL [Catenuloplanes indicus]